MTWTPSSHGCTPKGSSPSSARTTRTAASPGSSIRKATRSSSGSPSAQRLPDGRVACTRTSPGRAPVLQQELLRPALGDFVEHTVEARLALRLILLPADLELTVIGVHDLRV